METDFALEYIPLALSISKKFRQSMFALSIEYDDFNAEALLALVVAASRYDATRGLFHTFARTCITNHLFDLLKARSREHGRVESLEHLLQMYPHGNTKDEGREDWSSSNLKDAILVDTYHFEAISIEHIEVYNKFLVSLNIQQRYLLALYYWHGEECTQKELALMMEKRFRHSFGQSFISQMLTKMKHMLKAALYEDDNNGVVYSI